VITLDRDRLTATMQEQAALGTTGREGELNRAAPSDELADVYDWFVSQLEAEGLDVRVDAIGNVFGRREGTDSDLAPVLVGSHLDSHAHGGIYDGALGVISALELLCTLEDADIQTRRPIEVVSWFNEEAARYDPGLMGSSVWAGLLDLEEMYAKTDEDGVVLEDELDRIGYKGDVPAEPSEEYDSYFELHIEQGQTLAESGMDVGVVTGIIGMTYGLITFDGQTDHTGGTQMHNRQDALVAAADVISTVQSMANDLGDRTVGSVGHITASPNNVNAVPGEVTISWEFRDPDDDIVETACERVIEEAERAATAEGVGYETEERFRAESVRFDNTCRTAASRAAETLDYESMDIFSGGGHDAQIVQHVCDAGMVFAVNDSGKSHTAEEETSWDNCYRGANTLANAVVDAAGRID
jgi:N-carbamoyl-L-amino-acid hydrolase